MINFDVESVGFAAHQPEHNSVNRLRGNLGPAAFLEHPDSLSLVRAPAARGNSSAGDAGSNPAEGAIFPREAHDGNAPAFQAGKVGSIPISRSSLSREIFRGLHVGEIPMLPRSRESGSFNFVRTRLGDGGQAAGNVRPAASFFPSVRSQCRTKAAYSSRISPKCSVGRAGISLHRLMASTSGGVDGHAHCATVSSEQSGGFLSRGSGFALQAGQSSDAPKATEAGIKPGPLVGSCTRSK